MDITKSVLKRPVYIKDEGDFFTVNSRRGKIDIPKYLLDKFKKWLWDCRIEYDPLSEL